MPRKPKESTPFSMRMDSTVYNNLDEFCSRTGQSKTFVIEAALKGYMDAYERKMQYAEQHINEVQSSNQY